MVDQCVHLRVGDASDKFMVVYASNQPEQFDWAINDRIDDMIEFELPSASERYRMLCYYMDRLTIVENAGDAKIMTFDKPHQISIDEDIDGALLRAIADELDGYSGRAIHKLVAAWQAAAYGSDTPHLNRTRIEYVLEEQMRSHLIKTRWEGIK